MNRIIIGLGMFMFGILLFGLSFHNTDLAVNMMHGAIDTNVIGYRQDRNTMYMNGMGGLITAEIFQMMGMLMAVSSAIKKVKHEQK